MFCEGDNCAAIIRHDDQFRGVSHGYVDRLSGTAFRFVSPDYFRLVPWQGDGLKPVGYGYDSIEAIVQAALRVNARGAQACDGDRRPWRARQQACSRRSTTAASSPRRPTARSTNW